MTQGLAVPAQLLVRDQGGACLSGFKWPKQLVVHSSHIAVQNLYGVFISCILSCLLVAFQTKVHLIEQ